MTLLPPLPQRLSAVRSDGYFTLLLSLGVIGATAGLSLAAAWAHVLRAAAIAPTMPDPPADCVLVLGSLLDGDEVGPDYVARLDRATRLPGTPRILLLGGRTGPGALSEAEAGRRWLLARGVAAERIHVEEQSLNTLENLHAARRLLPAATENCVLITSRFHLARTAILAGSLGLRLDFCAAETRFRPRPRVLARCLLEAAFVNWYYCGLLWASATRNRSMLARIR